MGDESKDPQATGQLEGRYANVFQIGQNAFEFVLKFGQVSPESGQVQFHTRIITGPVYAKTWLGALGESIAHYEQTFGVIPEQGK